MSKGRPLTAEDFGELVNSENFTSAMLNLNTNLDGTKAMLELIAKCDIEKLGIKDQVMIDLYMAFAINSLYWMFLRTKGINPATQAIKSEINRVRECVGRANKVHKRKQPPRLNKDAAKRFIRSGLWQPGERPTEGVIKKFSTNVVDVNASTTLNKPNINEEGDETKPFKAPNGSTEGGVKKEHSTEAPNGSTESGFKMQYFTTFPNDDIRNIFLKFNSKLIDIESNMPHLKGPYADYFMKDVDKKDVDKKAVDNKAVDKKAVDKKDVDKKDVDKKDVDKKDFVKKDFDKKAFKKAFKTRQEKEAKKLEDRKNDLAYMRDPYNISRSCRELSLQIILLRKAKAKAKSEASNGITGGI